MNILKKLFAVVSSIAIITSAMSSVVFAEVKTPVAPTVSFAITEQTDNEGVYDLNFDVETHNCVYGNKIFNIQVLIELDSEKIYTDDLVKYTTVCDETTDWEDVSKYDNITFGRSAFFTLDGISYKENIFTYTLQSGSGISNAQAAPHNIFTLKNLKLREGVSTEDFDITVTGLELTVGSTAEKWVFRDNNLWTPELDGEAFKDSFSKMDNVPSVTFPGNKTDDGDDDEPEITQGVITKEQSGSENDEAVWAWTTAAATGKFLKVYADVTKVGATEATAVNNIFEIPANVEATNVKVGIVVQYNPTNIAEFVVTGMEIVSSAN